MTVAKTYGWWRGAVLAAAWSAFSAAAPLAAPSPAKTGEAAYSHRVWNRDQGLPNNAVERLLQTRDGWLWVGTREGLARFDGVTFTVFDGRTPDFTSDAVLDLAEDAQGNLWIATKHGLYRRRDGGFTRFTARDGLLHDHVNNLQPARDGGMWVATQGGVNRFHDGRLADFPSTIPVTGKLNPPHSDHEVFAVAEDAAGEIWTGTWNGLCRLNRESRRFSAEWPIAGPATPGDSTIVREAMTERESALWFGTNFELVRRNGERLQTFQFEPDVGDIRLRRIARDRSGTIWTVRGGKVFQVRGDTLVRFAVAGLADIFVSDLSLDQDGNVWVASRYSGLHQLVPSQVSVFTTKEGLSHNTINSVSPSGDGGLWVGTARGLMRLHDNRFEFPPSEIPLQQLSCRTVFEDRSGDVWVGLARGSLILPNVNEVLWLERFGAGFRVRATDTGPNEPSALAEDRQQRLWVGGRSGLSCFLTNRLTQAEIPPAENYHVERFPRLRATRWTWEAERLLRYDGRQILAISQTEWIPVGPGPESWSPLSTLPASSLDGLPIPLEQRLSGSNVRFVHEDRAGTVWFGTWGSGLNRLRSGRLDVLTTRDGLAGDFIRALHEDADGSLWVGTTTGLSRLTTTLTTASASAPPMFTFRTEQGLPDDEANQIIEDDAGHLWIGCSKGVYRVARDHLADVAAGRSAIAPCLLLDEDDGLLAGETSNGAQPTACRTADGKLWFATPEGLVSINPETVAPRTKAPLVFIESLRTGTNELDLFDLPQSGLGLRPRSSPA